MNRRDFLKNTGLIGGAAAGAGTLAAPAIAQSMPKLNWRLTSAYPATLDTLFGSAVKVADYVSAATDGNFSIEVFAGGEIAPPLEAADAVTAGTAEMAHTATSFYWERDPTWAVASALPFGLNDRQQNAWLYYGNGHTLINEFLAGQGFYGLPCGNTGTQMGGWFRREINTVADLQGLRFRVAGLGGRILERLGVATRQTAASDIEPALEDGSLDAAEFSGPHDDLELGLYRVAKFYYYPGWWESGPAIHLLIGLDRWNDLPTSYQAILTAACQAANVDTMAAYDYKNPVALRELVARGVELRPFSQEILSACFDAAEASYAEIGADNPAFRKIYQDLVAFRGDSFHWWQSAEHTYDTFMIDRHRAGRL